MVATEVPFIGGLTAKSVGLYALSNGTSDLE